MNQMFFVLLAILGIGFLIFIHELGHYLCARLVGIRVLVFSLGFGPRIGGFVRNGTDYRLSIVPLGGYVRVAGEDPLQRTFADDDHLYAKSVPARALFFAGGVLMNLLFAVVAFPVVFKNGVEFTAPVVGAVQRGSPAWEHDLRAGDRLVSIDGKRAYSFEDLMVEIALAGDRTVELVVQRDARVFELRIRPRYEPGIGLYQLGIGQPSQPQLGVEARTGTPAHAAGLRPDDVLVAIHGQPASTETLERLVARRYQPTPVELDVLRAGQTHAIRFVPATVESPRPLLGVDRASRRVIGLRAGLAELDALGLQRDDHIVKLDGQPFAGTVAAMTTGPETMTLSVVRGTASTPLVLTGRFPPAARAALADHLALGQDHRDLVVAPHPDSPAALAGMQPGDAIVMIDGRTIADWEELQATVQRTAPGQTRVVRVLRGDQPLDLQVQPTHQQVDLGFTAVLTPLREIYRETTVTAAIAAGGRHSIDLIKSLYVTLKKLFTGEVAAKNLGGIITISRATYAFAQSGWARFVYFLALLSINLAVINLLPIPVLDGGHLLFVFIEGIKGSPISPRVLNYSQIMGLVFIVALLLFVTYNDILRLL